jgi:dephospho-CoA kinase
VALTGGIATGKSYSLRRFAERGAATIDADALAREAVRPGTPALAAIADRFGRGVLHEDGSLDRARLGRLVFADEDARRALEAIVHPAVYRAIDAWFEACARTDPPPAVAIAEIPLLLETGRDADFDAVVVAACSEEQQRERLRARDGMSEADVDRRLRAQMPIDLKVQRADYVVDTSGTTAETDEAIDAIWLALTAGE